MQKTRLIGDIHGDLSAYEKIIEGSDNSIQIGDFGIGFAGDYWHEKVADLHTNPNRRFIRGNHDDPGRCRETAGWIPDGTVQDDVMFIGGAWSIDAGRRVEGVSWWRDEENSWEDFYRFIDIYAQVKPRVLITHDCPTEISKTMFIDSGLSLGDTAFKTRTGTALQNMFELHQPEQWYFGHWHHTKTYLENDTKFMCLGIDDFIDVNL